jgi:signal transduction histidine kinase
MVDLNRYCSSFAKGGILIEREVLLKALPHLAYLKIKADKICAVSSSFVDMTGYFKAELINKTLSEVFNLIFRNPDICNKIQRGRTTKELFLFTKLNDVRIVKISHINGLLQDEYYLVFTEIEGLRFEEKFPYAEQLLKSDCIGLAVFSIPDYILLRANHFFLRCLDEPFNRPGNSIGCPISKLVKGQAENYFENIFNQSVQERKVIHLKECKLSLSGRDSRYLEVIVTPIFEGCLLKYIVTTLTDITDSVLEKKACEEEISEIVYKNEELAKTLRMREEFFSLISHEFKTPITVILAALQAMRLVCKDEMSGKAKKFLRQIRQNSLQLLRLLNNILDISRAESGFMKVYKKNIDIVFVTKAIIESVAVYARGKDLVLDFNSSLPRKVIALDVEKYERILLNLLSNAIKFTSPGKSIKIKLWSERKKVCISVIDKGIGIPYEKQQLIFNLFSQVDSEFVHRTGGTGIGLFLVKKFVSLLDGEIILESEEEKGSSFTIVLPSDKIIEEAVVEESKDSIDEKRLIQLVDVEFSDIYQENQEDKDYYDVE